MVRSAHNVVLLGIVKVLVEVLIPDVGAFGSLDEYKGDGCALYLCIAQLVPIDVSLIVGDVQTTHFPVRVGDVSVKGFPSKRVGTHESLIEESDVGNDDNGKRCP